MIWGKRQPGISSPWAAGGFSTEPENPLLDDFVLGLTSAQKPRVCFVGTASGDAYNYRDRFYQAFDGRAETTHLSLFERYPEDLRTFVLRQHVLYVGGGNTANLLAIWRVHGLDAIMREAWAAGVVLAGISAGMICWFEASVTDSFGGPLAPLHDGLRLLPGSACPHYDGEVNRRPTYRRLIGEGTLPAGYAADDGVALHFVGRQLAEVVTSRPHARAYWVQVDDHGKVCEAALRARYLGEAQRWAPLNGHKSHDPPDKWP